MKINLSMQQREIVDFGSGALLVKAGPGSGKTRVLIERVKKLLCNHKRTKILALTFSNMAAEEMRSRIEDDHEIEEFSSNVTIGTIHSFCLDIVQNRGYLIGLPNSVMLFENFDDRKKVLLDAMQKDNELKEILKTQSNPNVYLTNVLSLISDYKKKFVLPSDTKIAESNAMIYAAYNEQLLSQNAIDFDDILLFAYRILTEYQSVAKLFTTQYKYICVDEAQDLNYAQYEVIKALCGNEFQNIMFVGDANQSIYGFNGSDSKLMTETFVRDFSPTILSLNENFRSAKEIVNFANTLEESNDYPNCYYDGELKLFSFDTEKDEAKYVIDKIQYLMENGHKDIESFLNYSDFAIVARNKYVLNEIENLLQSNSIPYSFKKSSTGIESESIAFKMFDLELRLLSNPKDLVHMRELDGIIKECTTDTDYSFVHQIVDKSNPENFNLKTVLKQMEEKIAILNINDDEKYMAINDCNLWNQHWARYVAQVPSEQRTLVSFRNCVALGKTQIVDTDNGVSLLTAHMSKGLQYEVVFVVGLTEGTFPDYRAVQNGGKALEQEKNNMYVAVTRAKRLCYLSYPKVKKMPWGGMKSQQRSEFIRSLKESNKI